FLRQRLFVGRHRDRLRFACSILRGRLGQRCVHVFEGGGGEAELVDLQPRGMGESADGADVLSTDVQRGALIGCERDREIGTFEHLGQGGGGRGAHPAGGRGGE